MTSRSKEEICGTLSVIDLLRAVRTELGLNALVQNAVFVPEHAWAKAMLEQLEHHGRAELALLVDEYGGISDMITLTDSFGEFTARNDRWVPPLIWQSFKRTTR